MLLPFLQWDRHGLRAHQDQGIGLGAVAAPSSPSSRRGPSPTGVELRVTPQLGNSGLTPVHLQASGSTGRLLHAPVRQRSARSSRWWRQAAVAAIGGLYVGKALGTEVPLSSRTSWGASPTPCPGGCGRRSLATRPWRPSATPSARPSASSGCSPPPWRPCRTGRTTKDVPPPCRTGHDPASNARTPLRGATSTRGSARRSPSCLRRGTPA